MSFFDKVSKAAKGSNVARTPQIPLTPNSNPVLTSSANTLQDTGRRTEYQDVDTGWGNQVDSSSWDDYKKSDDKPHVPPLVDRLREFADNGAFTLADNLIVDPVRSVMSRSRDVGEDSDVNMTYAQDFRDSGMSQSDIHDIYDRNSDFLDILSGERWGKPVETLNPSVDDGITMDYSSLTSDYMTGSRYIHYRDDLGMGGRDGWIDPNGIYSKADEAAQYGFTPFTPDMTTAINGGITSSLSSFGQAGQDFSRLREDLGNLISPFQATIDGDQVNGWELRNTAQPYVNQVSNMCNYEPETVLNQPRHGQYTLFAKEWHVMDQSGNMTVHRGSMSQDARTGAFVFSDGTSVIPSASWVAEQGGSYRYDWVPVGNERWSQLDGARLNVGASADDIGTWGAMYLPDLVMSDGTRVDYMQASRFMGDRYAKGDERDEGISYDFGPFNISRPMEYSEMEMFGDGDRIGMLTTPTFNPGAITDIPSSVIDLTLGSAPIMIPGFDWVYSTSSAIPAMSGIDPSSYDSTGNYYSRFYASQIDPEGRIQYGVAPDPNSDIDPALSNELRLAATAGNFLVPLTEQLVGPVGEGFLNVPVQTFTKGPLAPRSAAGRFALGAVEEGLEEIFGNAFEDWTANGLAGWYADPLLDENGEEMYDSAGRRYVDYDTPFLRRLGNYALDLPGNINAFLGGASIGGVMTARDRINQARAAGGPFNEIPFWALSPEEQAAEIERIENERERQQAMDDAVIDPRFERLTGPQREGFGYRRRGDM